MTKLAALVTFAALPYATAGCKSVECGDGTIERDGTCVTSDDGVGPANCGPGTVLAPSGKCETSVICDPDTTVEQTDPATGITVCVGTGGGGNCSTPLAGCTTAAANTMTVCGRLYDIEDDTAIGLTSTDTSMCPAGGEDTGACSLQVLPFDAIAFSTNPTGTPPLTSSELYLDHCGRFRIKDIEPAGAPFIGLGVRNHPSHDTGNKLTGVAFPTSAGPSGGTKADVVAYTTRGSTDTAWATSSGLGGSLAQMGVYVNIYRDSGTPADPLAGNLAAGVQILRGGSPIPSNDYYFADADSARTEVDAGLTETGANGSGLVLGLPSLAPFTGSMGPLPGGCQWYSANGASIPNVVFVQIHTPVGTGCDF